MLPRRVSARAAALREALTLEALPLDGDMEEDGYRVLLNAVEVTDAFAARMRERATRASPIFQTQAPDTNDFLRLQEHLDGDTLSEVNLPGMGAYLQRLAGRGVELHVPVLLVTRVGARGQVGHTDWHPHEIAARAAGVPLPFSILIALKDGTKFHLWRRMRMGCVPPRDLVPTRRGVITLPKGAILEFAGDVVHAGAGAATRADENVRVHAYCDVPGVLRDADATYFLTLEQAAFAQNLSGVGLREP